MSASLLLDEEAAFRAWQTAYELFLQGGDRLGAVRAAFWIADSLIVKGEPAVANGWVGRARSLLDGLALAPEHGWMCLLEAEALLQNSDADASRSLARKSGAIGRSTGDTGLEMCSLGLEGLSLVSGGLVSEGMSKLDEAAAACLAGEVKDFWVLSCVLCMMMMACNRARDYERARQWIGHVERLAKRWANRELLIFCLAHYAGVLMCRGLWEEAEAELRHAIDDLGGIWPSVVTESTARLAELRRRQGRWEEAAALFEAVKNETLGRLGLAALALDRGRLDLARDEVERCLRRLPRSGRLDRVPALELHVRLCLDSRNLDEAKEALAELEEIAALVQTKPVLASASLARGLIACTGGDLDESRRRLEDAVDLFAASEAPFEASQARLELAKALVLLGRCEDAARQIYRALAAFKRLGAQKEAERARRLLAGIRSASGISEPGVGETGLTQREIEVLHLLAIGLSNQEIALELVVSTRTVERHISNIYQKLGLTGRSARAAAAAHVFSAGPARH